MLDEITLHIGTEKTGTTYIQNFLRLNRRYFLRQQRVLIPESAGQHNHLKLPCLAADWGRDAFRRMFSISCKNDLEKFKGDFEQALLAEIEEHEPTRLVFSNEHCHSRLISCSEISRLREFLCKFARKITIVVYFRRQDLLAVSHFSTLLKVGNQPTTIIPVYKDNTPYFGSEFPYYFDHFQIYCNYCHVFGEENIIASVFEQSSLKGGDILVDFCGKIGLELTSDVVKPARSNESLKPVALYFLKLLRASFDSGGPLNWQTVDLQKIAKKLEKNYCGNGPLPAKNEAIQFYKRFKDSNQQLKEKAFPERETLFSEDFSSYPDAPFNWDIDDRDLIRIFHFLSPSSFV